MAEYINRDKLNKLIDREIEVCNSGMIRGALEYLKAIVPIAADVVEVFRCKDCKWFGRDLGYGKHDCKKYEMPYCLETDFCSYGERRGNDETDRC